MSHQEPSAVQAKPCNPAAASALYPQLLGSSWEKLADAVRAMHYTTTPVRASGSLRVERGKSFLARALIWVLGLPSAGAAIPTTLAVTQAGKCERWTRVFAGRPFVTVQWPSSRGLLVEYFGLCELHFHLEAHDGDLIYRQANAVMRLGPLRLPLPSWLAPQVSAHERAAPEPHSTNISVHVRVPLLGLLVAYQGTMTLE